MNPEIQGFYLKKYNKNNNILIAAKKRIHSKNNYYHKLKSIRIADI